MSGAIRASGRERRSYTCYPCTKPSAIATRAPPANAKGWNNTDVTVSFSGTDNGDELLRSRHIGGPCRDAGLVEMAFEDRLERRPEAGLDPLGSRHELIEKALPLVEIGRKREAKRPEQIVAPAVKPT